MMIDDERLSPGHNNLTLVRLLLASAVIWTHSFWRANGVSGVDHFSPWLGAPVSVFAVDGFFFLSGFLVYASLVRRGKVRDFAVARLARLWPALAVSILLTTIAGAFLTSTPGLTYLTGDTAKFLGYNLSLLVAAFYLTGVHCGAELCNINGSLWTIPWEVRCYVLLAILGLVGLAKPLAMKRLILPATLIVAMAIHIPGMDGVIRAHLGTGIAYAAGLGDRLWSAFALGIAAYVWRDRIRLRWWHTLLLLGILVATTAMNVEVPHLGQIFIASAVLNLGFLAAKRGAVSAGWPDYSYGMYVYAFPVMMLVAAALPTLRAEALALVTALATVVPAALSWHLVEKPVLDLVRDRRSRAAWAAKREKTMTGANDGGSARAIRVGLLWHSPNSGNLGIGALTAAHIALIDRAARRAGVVVDYTILGFVDPGAPEYVHHPRVKIVALKGKVLLPGGGFGAALAGIDVMLDIGGGDSFCEIYGWKRFAYLFLTKCITRLHRVPLVLAPQTIGPFERQPYRTLATAIMKSADLVVARDPQSYRAARGMSPAIQLMQAIDVAFALPYDPPAPRVDGMIRVGVNPSGLLFNRGYSGSNEFGMELDYASYSRQLITRLLEEPGVEVWLLSHVNSDVLAVDDDRSAVATLHAEFPATKLAPAFASPEAAKSFVARLDFLVSGRMHACIAAHSSGVPVVPVAYSRKFTGLFADLLGYPHIVPVSGMGTDAAVDFTMARFRSRHDLKADIDKAGASVAAMLDRYESYLSGLIANIARASQPAPMPGRLANGAGRTA